MSPDEFRIVLWFDQAGRYESGSIAAYAGGEKVTEFVPAPKMVGSQDLHQALEVLLQDVLDTWGVQGSLF